MAADIFLKIEGIEGESKDTTHDGELELQHWNWSMANQGSMHAGQGGGTGKVHMGDFTFGIITMKGSPKLQDYCARGEHIPSATLTVRKAGGEQQEYLVYKFTDLLISSFSIAGAGDLPNETISFNFTKIEGDYGVQDEKGVIASHVKWGYDLKLNKKV